MVEKKTFNNQKGFTLVEIAIVLVIIGLIMGAVVKGKDIMRSAEQKKIYQKFLNEWRNAYLTFYDRTGVVLGDQVAPFDGRPDTGAVAAPTAAGQAALITGGGTAPNTFLGLNSVGITPPQTNTTTNYNYRYTDSAGASQTLGVAFSATTAAPIYNYMLISNMTNEMAIAVDTLVDGRADGQNGDFLNAAGTAWGTGGPTGLVTARWKMEF